MLKAEESYGLVLCGGKSSRMDTDKAFLTYHNKPQCYYLYEMLEKCCGNILISCNENQSEKFDPGYNLLLDDTDYHDSGPIAGILSAFKKYPGKDFLVLGCDYPYIGLAEIQNFIKSIPGDIPAAFFNASANLYDPLLAWYPRSVSQKLFDFYNAGNFSLQKFLSTNNAFKYTPPNQDQLISVDTQEGFTKVNTR
jgi:molybdopterin-guanine dinucleotide biosynthesis protein A